MTRTLPGIARLTALTLCSSLTLGSTPAEAYLKIGVSSGDTVVNIRWTAPRVRYFVSDQGLPDGVTAAQFQAAVARAYATWEAVPTAGVAYEFAGFTGAEPLDEDEANVVGFLDRPELERVLASTNFLVDVRTGGIIESDIFFNSAFLWSAAENGTPGRFDVQSIATHEAGHFLGLGHSALGETELRPAGGRRVIAAEAVMFPIAFTAGSTNERRLRPDDVVGASDIYPAGDFGRETGSITGRITKNGRGLFGAHVVAFDLTTGELVGNFSLNDDGDFVIAGLRPGPHALRVEPLDDGELESFFDRTEGVDLDFRVTFSETLAIVPRGGTTRRIDITVAPK